MGNGQTWGSHIYQERGLGGTVENNHKSNLKTELLIPFRGDLTHPPK